MLVQAAPASAGHSVDPLYCLLCLQSKICLEGALNFAFSGSLTERSHDPDIFFFFSGQFSRAERNQDHNVLSSS